MKPAGPLRPSTTGKVSGKKRTNAPAQAKGGQQHGQAQGSKPGTSAGKAKPR